MLFYWLVKDPVALIVFCSIERSLVSGNNSRTGGVGSQTEDILVKGTIVSSGKLFSGLLEVGISVFAMVAERLRSMVIEHTAEGIAPPILQPV